MNIDTYRYDAAESQAEAVANEQIERDQATLRRGSAAAGADKDRENKENCCFIQYQTEGFPWLYDRYRNGI